MWWTCPKHQVRTEPAIVRSQECLEDIAGDPDLECLWFRGLLPQDLVDGKIQNLPADDIIAKWVGNVPEDQQIPSGEYHTDASGGTLGTDPLLRRCGCGIAKVTPTMELVFGLHFPLAGRP